MKPGSPEFLGPWGALRVLCARPYLYLALWVGARLSLISLKPLFFCSPLRSQRHAKTKSFGTFWQAEAEDDLDADLGQLNPLDKPMMCPWACQ